MRIMGKKLLAGILGGLAFFMWSFVAHMLTGLAATGVQEMQNEQAVVAAAKANIPSSGFYIFPGSGLPPGASNSERMKAMQSEGMQAKMKAGPTGILVFNAGPGEGVTPKRL